MKTPLAAVTAGFAVLIGSNAAIAAVLYNGLSIPSQTLAQQGWMYLWSAVPPAPTAIATTNGTILDTSGTNANYAGYFRQSPVTLDRIKGYTITFRVQINSESHSSNNRAGFSMMAISNKLANEQQPYGIELSFWENSIWAQDVGFTRGENVAYDTKASAKTYKLTVKDTNYQLSVTGIVAPILQGKLRQYTGFTPPPGYKNPYTTPNLLFLGDNTTSAKAKVTIVSVEVN
ncbi:choice-of-anchor Y domain-containing protein [Calothrix sp. NIES-2098]|uniref:choice-of-anchor Y domain-containing protein n=1 Tax=Calothrix sp. NIES-2098 TaxID=1954171 RepID=UPI000B61FE0A|nr:Na-Ca exchanger/integrin-beta4 [Calothrix sp. NIES-2098]